ncbi:HofP DNA utilization family protein [Dickeya chrysanthemi]|uniref:HofP DNA utilization family protein n=1 Tax=Dickeya chrysanthemi TaxID=556 RepID=UPI00067AC35F|nr:HofP DNA utilization family protein [Dickeya chrysanthemi]
MKRGWIGVLRAGLFLYCMGAEAVTRDPFQPLSTASCDDNPVKDKWQLKGMVGSSSQWVGWLFQPQSHWLRVRDGDVLPLGDWQVMRLDRSGVVLRTTGGQGRCGTAEIHLNAPFHHNME